jgi:hypothetical protein
MNTLPRIKENDENKKKSVLENSPEKKNKYFII